MLLEQTRQKKAWHSYLELEQVLSYSGLEESVQKACYPSSEMTFVGVLFNSNNFTLKVTPEWLIKKLKLVSG